MAVIDGTNRGETLNGGIEDDTINGFGGNDIINGNDGNDTINGGTGNDTLTGGAGNDRFVYDVRGFGGDTITDFVQGQDRIDLSGLGVGDFSQLQSFLTRVDNSTRLILFFAGSTETLTISNILPVQLTAADFIFQSDATGVLVEGSSGNDVLFGSLGPDTINGLIGNDTILAGAGNDTITGGTGADTLTGGVGEDVFVYDARGFGADTITDFVRDQDRVDLSALGVGDFSQLLPFITLVGNSARLNLFFNGTAETITFANVLPTQLTTADFIFQTATTGFQVGGTSGNDLLLGSLGPDTISGLNGNDTIVAGFGNDIINGGAGTDSLTGSAGNDRFVYDARGFGADTITDFVQGLDVVDLSALNFGDFAQLQPFITQVGGSSRLNLVFFGNAETITFSDILPTQLTAADFIFQSATTGFLFEGSNGIDVLLDSLGSDTLIGFNGNDTIVAGAGNDAITGGGGNDTLTGGAGNDLFVYDIRRFDADTITDFVQGQDRIDLSSLRIGDFSQLQPFLTQVSSSARLNLFFGGNTETITFSNILPTRLTAADFIFQSSTTGFLFDGTLDVDLLLGSLGPDTINGYNGNDTIVAGAGNDTIDGGTGNDIINGGLGIDTVIVNATRAQITVSRGAGGVVTLSSAADGTDTLSNVEFVRVQGIDFRLSQYADTTVPRLNDFTVGAGGWSTQDRFLRQMADVNGDGLADIVGFGQAGTLVALGTAGGSFAQPFVAVANFGVNQGWTSDNIFRRELADVNGDGRDDIVGFGTAGVLVSLAQAGGSFGAPAIASTNFNPANGWATQDGFARTLADVNGDGFADIIGFGTPGTFVALGSGNGSFGAATFALANFGTNQGWSSNNIFHREVGDVNGDGRADIVGFGTAGTLVALGQANGTFAAPVFALGNFGTNQGWSSQDVFTRDLADVNGDGRDDIVGFGVAGTFVAYGQANGTFGNASFDVANFGRDQGWTSDNIFHRELADVNGDGRADIVGFGQNGVFAAIAFDGQVI